jgi:hypothetical protein
LVFANFSTSAFREYCSVLFKRQLAQHDKVLGLAVAGNKNVFYGKPGNVVSEMAAPSSVVYSKASAARFTCAFAQQTQQTIVRKHKRGRHIFIIRYYYYVIYIEKLIPAFDIAQRKGLNLEVIH